MPRQVRTEYRGATYHVMSRDNRRRAHDSQSDSARQPPALELLAINNSLHLL